MQDRVRLGVAGPPDGGEGRAPEAWGAVAAGEVGAIVDAVAGRSFLYEDPPSFRAGVDALARALLAAGLFPQGLPA